MCMWFYCCRWSYLQVSFQRCHYPNFLRGIPANRAQEAHTLLSTFTDCFPVLHVDCFKWILLDLCGCLDFSFFLLFLHCASIKHWRFIVCGIGLQKHVVWMVHTSCAAMTISRYKSAVLPGPFCLFFGICQDSYVRYPTPGGQRKITVWVWVMWTEGCKCA